jgi:general secretion pathway protein G
LFSVNFSRISSILLFLKLTLLVAEKGYFLYNKDMKRKSSFGGFTLIELLVVIAIISVLSALLMANFVGVRQRGRDAQRKSDLRQIQAALELYRADVGSYPTALPGCGSSLTYGSATYLQKIPCDPLMGGPYAYTSAGTTYSLRACLENSNDPQKDATNNCTGWAASFTVNNP